MKDNNLTHKFWARAVAFCLFCVMTAILACCIAGVVYCYSKEWYKTGLNVTFTTEGDEWDYAIDGTNAIMTDKTGFKEFAYKNRNSMMVYGFIAGITALACFVFLICSAAHRSGTEDCVLLRQDKMPYDLYLPSAILLGTGLCAMLVECVAYELNTVKAVAAALIMACLAGVFMALCMTTAARIKTGTLFKNTLIYRLCTGVGMGASSMLSSISGAWRFSLAFAGYLLINALLSYRFFTRGGFLAFLLLIAVNGGALYLLLNMIRQMRTLSAAGQAMANGDLSYCVDTSDMKREFREHGENLNSIGRGMAIAVNERMKSERFKTELITNVSHDLKTPLTSVIGYLTLLSDEPDLTPEMRAKYTGIALDKAQRLDVEAVRAQIPDLVTMSAREERGVEELEQAILRKLRLEKIDLQNGLLINERQRQATSRAAARVVDGLDALRAGMTYDAVAVEIDEAIAALSELTGESAGEQVIDAVFANFCVGK